MVRKSPHWLISCIPLVFLVVLLFFVVRHYGSDALEGASQVALLLSAGLAIALGMAVCKQPWKSFESAIESNFSSVASAIIILLLIGAVSGSWMVSGVVPTLVCYGLKIISPKIFLLACCLITALVAVMTGSSWTTIATVGVALMAIGSALGYSEGWTAGAIISGAYFGDKISPLSDTTVLASSTSGTPLFTHIRYMLLTTVPSISIAAVVFFFVSIFHSGDAAAHAQEYVDALSSTYHVRPILLLVPIFTLFLIVRKVPAVLTLMLSALAAGIFALIFQPEMIAVIGAGENGLDFASCFKGLMNTWFSSTSAETGSEAVNELVATSGMRGMLNTVFLILCALTFGAAMTGSGMLQSITEALTRRIHKRTPLVATTVGTGVFCNLTTGDQYLSIILTCSLYKKLYEENGFESRLLSRSAEDSATVTSVLIPWNSCGMTQATVLGVATLTYLPYCIFNIVSPMMSILVASTGFRIVQNVKK
ncbi:MAG: sodium:proton antiporter [Bacteroidales bacterium]|nr:sodium:proton antiporter [Bacteroidales bacterium]